MCQMAMKNTLYIFLGEQANVKSNKFMVLIPYI